MHSSAAKRILAIVAVLALVIAGSHGASYTFLCLCAGTPVKTSVDHCDGPAHGAQCIEAHAKDDCRPGDAHHDEEKQDHLVIQTELKSSVPAKALSAPEHGGALVALLPLAWRLDAEPTQFFSAPTCGRALDSPPPLALRHSRTVSLLI